MRYVLPMLLCLAACSTSHKEGGADVDGTASKPSRDSRPNPGSTADILPPSADIPDVVVDDAGPDGPVGAPFVNGVTDCPSCLEYFCGEILDLCIEEGDTCYGLIPCQGSCGTPGDCGCRESAHGVEMYSCAIVQCQRACADPIGTITELAGGYDPPGE